MADEKAGKTPAASGGGGGFLKIIIIIVVVAMIAGGGGAFFIIKKMHAEKPAAGAEHKEEKKVAEEEHKDSEGGIPPDAVTFDLDDAQATVMPDPNSTSSPVLMYSVSLVCSNLETSELVKKNKQLFVAKVAELHRFRTKSELNDPTVEKSILRQALQDCNALLKQLQKKPNPEFRIVEALHVKYAVFDL